MEDIFSDPELSEQLKNLVLERVGTMPETLGVFLDSKSLTKNDMHYHVKQVDAVGKEIMEMELRYLRDLVSGKVYSYE